MTKLFFTNFLRKKKWRISSFDVDYMLKLSVKHENEFYRTQIDMKFEKKVLVKVNWFAIYEEVFQDNVVL